jgi:hypothetical protein
VGTAATASDESPLRILVMTTVGRDGCKCELVVSGFIDDYFEVAHVATSAK